ncbi:topoisomerase i [Colletotrichum truncatum]|uniref:Topoisomerase i n=1 Tax=Colletotrichum truncatum TaxID=5467 RepID=A0ACC3Z3W2_COLTU|nr:topoisomerase i [Colletotrichum truncatum]KAF6795633.1 topoisomerase i [Colletotrichum truncatum]
MSSSDDDMPLARSNGHVSSSRVSKADDHEMDRTASKARAAPPGISVRHGPVDDEMDIDGPSTNGAKRKSRSSLPKVNYKVETDSDDDVPMAKRQKTKQKLEDSDSDDEPLTARRGKKLPPSYKETALPDDSSDDDQPLGAKLAKKKAEIEKAAAKEARSIRASEAKSKKATPKKAMKDESDDDEPLAKSAIKKRQSNGAGSAKKKSNGVKAESDSDEPIAVKARKAAAVKPVVKGKAATPAKGPVKKAAAKAKQESEAPEDEEEEEYEWWNAPKKEDDSQKWTTLEHNGVLFPPEYTPLPKNVKLLYDGKPVNLPIEAEEVAWYFGSMLSSKHNVDNPVFQKNFFEDFKQVLKESGKHATDSKGNKVDIKDFSKMDFNAMWQYAEQQSLARKNRTAAEKKAAKAEKDEMEAPYMYCKWDGRKEKVGNFRVEPPSLFRGRGEHPKTGKFKRRVYPEQITINIGKDAKVPEPPKGHKWKAVVHDNKATWLAMWQENINGAYKYVMLGAASAIKGQSDMKKFEKARELKKHIDKIRRDYTRDLKSEVMADRQRATAVYLIDKFALRAGNEKDAENEAETVGCCSLKYEHITLREPNTVIFDFLGKDSIRFYDEVTVEKQVFKNLKLFKKPPKTDGDDIFDRLTTTQLNNHLKNYMPGLTAKVFRTYNASFTMSNLLQKLKVEDLTIQEKVKLYNDCNREVAILCNHKRTVGAAHEAQMEKLGDRIKGLRYQQWRTKMMMLDVDPKMKKKKGADFFARPEELDDAWILEHQAFLVEEQRTKITKKFQKDNEKRAADGEKPLPEKELKERLKAADELAAKFKKENKSKKVEAEGRSPTVEKLDEQAKKIDDRIKNLELQAADRDGNKEVALSTSKINYIDPRLTVVFSKKFDVPIEKFFSKTLREKFSWAIKSVEDEDWEF